MEDNAFEKRLYLLLVIGSSFEKTIEQIETLQSGFLSEMEEEPIVYGNSIFFVSDLDIPTLGKKVKKDLGTSLAYVMVDITDNLNPYDFIANITKEHNNSDRFVKAVKSFLRNQNESSEVMEELSLEEKLENAIRIEDFEEAAKIRDEIRQKKELKTQE